MEAAVTLRTALLRNVLGSLDQPLVPDRTAAIAQLLVGSGLLSGGPDGSQGGIWAPVTELQGKLLENLLKQLTKAEAAFRPGAAVLLGVVCRHVPARTFLSSYGDWAAALLEALRRDTGTAPRAAELHALGRLFIRVRELVDVPGVRRDASSIAARTLQLATPLLSDPGCQVAALSAVHSVLEALPTVARNHTTPLETQLASLLAAPATQHAARATAAAALAQLPRAAAADAPAWSTLCRRTLLSLHTAIDLLFYYGGAGLGGTGAGGAGAGAFGVEATADGGLGARAREHLAAPPAPGAADAEGLLGPAGFVSTPSGGAGAGAGAGGAAAAAAGGGVGGSGARPGVGHTLQVTQALLDCLGSLLSSGYASPMPVPSHALLLLVMRLLRLDAAVLLAPGRVAPSSSAQAEVLAALPGLHCTAWRLLGLMCRVVRSGLMPLLALVGRVLAEHLRRVKAGGAGGLACTMPAAVRTSLYGAAVAVLRTGGFAAGRALVTETIGMLVTELYGLSAVQQQQQQQAMMYGAAAAAAGLGKAGGRPGLPLGFPPPSKKAKLGASSDPLAVLDLSTAAAVAAAVAPVTAPADVAAQRAALAVAEVLLQVYGPAMTSDQRGQLDALSYHMAAVCAEASLRLTQDASTAAVARAPDVAALRVAATRVLVASLTAPGPTRHSFLAEGLALLQEGAAGLGGLELTEVCSEGLLALEALLRPRSTPLAAGTGLVGSGGITGAGEGVGLQLPRPRLWSMMDPVQPQLPPLQVPVAATSAAAPAVAVAPSQAAAGVAPAAAAAGAAPPAPVSGTAKTSPTSATPAAKGDKAGAGAPDVVKGTGAGARAGVKGSGAEGAKPAKPTPTPARAAPAAAAAPDAANGKSARKQGKGADSGKAGAGRGARAKGNGSEGDAGSDAMEVDAGAAPAVAAATAGEARKQAAPSPASTPAAAAFGEESEDSEGSMPEIDSGDDSASGDDE